MGKSILKDKSYAFAIEVVKLCRTLQTEKKEFVLSRQLLRSGTAIGALVREAQFAQSRPDFISKMSIALKEANETYYWLLLLADTHSHSPDFSYTKLQSECNELISILAATVKTAKEKSKN